MMNPTENVQTDTYLHKHDVEAFLAFPSLVDLPLGHLEGMLALGQAGKVKHIQ